MVPVSPTPRDLETVTGAASQSRRGVQRLLSDRLGRYEVTGPLGVGGMGVVVCAYDPELDRKVAIKVLRPERRGLQAHSRMLREAQAMARLSHPNVVQIYDVGTADEQIYLAMEFIEGQTAKAWLRQCSRTCDEIVALFVEAGRGLAAAHANGIVHRDFKPDNVLIAGDGRVRVADFGIATYDGDDAPSEVQRSDRPPSTRRQALTATGGVIGTPRYMAPEQHGGFRVGPAADQFSFCVALYEALFGRPPFDASSSPQIVDDTIGARHIVPDDPSRASPWMIEVIRRGLSADAHRRFPTMEALLEALLRDPSARRKRRVRLVARIGAAAAAMVSASWLMVVAAEPRCVGGVETMRATWGAHRERIADAFVDAGDAGNGDAVVSTLDDYASAWAASQRDTCQAHQDGALSDRLFDAAVVCLDRRRASLHAYTMLFGDEVELVPERLATAAAKLPSVAWCGDPQRLADGVEDLEPDTARIAEVLRHRLLGVRVTHDAGRVPSALATLATVIEEADALGYRRLISEVALLQGLLAMDRMQWDVARAALERASHEGIAADADQIVAQAQVRLVFVVAVMSADPTAGRSHESWARAAIERIGNPPELVALLTNNLGVIDGMTGEYQAAAAAFAQSLALADRSAHVPPLEHSAYAINLAMHTRDADVRQRAFERAEALVEGALGPDHFERLDHAIRRAEMTVDPQRALDLIAPACLQLDRRQGDGPDRAHLCWVRVAELNDILGRRDEAASAARRAVAAVAAESGDPYGAALRLKARAYAAVLQDEPVFALRVIEQAQAMLLPQAQLPWVAVDLADLDVTRARALLALGRGQEIGSTLVQAIAVYDDAAQRSEDQAPRYRRTRAAQLQRRAATAR